MARTRLSSKGQVIIPKSVRQRHGWQAGVELDVEDRGEAIVLRPVSPFPQTKIEDVLGSLQYHGPRLTIREMDAAVLAEARKHR